MTACGRPTKGGEPCRAGRLTAFLLTDHDGYQSPACQAHITRAETLVYHHVIALEENRLRDYHRTIPVACHSWPVTDELAARGREHRAEPDQEKAYRLGWTLLADWHDHRCAICGGYSERLDHDHKTAMVRGWLCHCCNVGEGFLDMPGGRFERYRASNPASILGIQIRYHSPIFGWAEPEPSQEEMDAAAYRVAARLAELYSSR